LDPLSYDLLASGFLLLAGLSLIISGARALRDPVYAGERFRLCLDAGVPVDAPTPTRAEVLASPPQILWIASARRLGLTLCLLGAVAFLHGALSLLAYL